MTKRPDVKFFLDIAEHARWDEKELKDLYGNELVFINNERTDTQGFVVILGSLCGQKGTLLIGWRGSQQAQDWINDFNAWHQEIPYGNYSSKIRVHKGFLKCYKSVRGQVLEFISKNKDKFDNVEVAGHSLGGAISTLCAVDIQYNYGDLNISVYTSGAPAVGNKAFTRSYNKRVPDTTRTYMRKDIVPKLPPWWFGKRLHGGYKHVKKGYAIGPRSFWAGLKYYLKVGGKFAEKITNHSIDQYRKYC